MDEKDEPEAEDDTLLSLYPVFTQDLAFFKQQQWSITNYALLLDAAVIGAAQLPKTGVSTCERLVLCLAATVLTAGAICVLCSLQKSITRGRKRVAQLRRRSSKTLRTVIGEEAPDSRDPVAPLLLVVVLAGAVAVWWVVYWKAV